MNQPQIQSSLVNGGVLKFSLEQNELLRVRLIFAGQFLIVDRQLLLEDNQLLQSQPFVTSQHLLFFHQFLEFAHFRFQLADRLLRLLLPQFGYFQQTSGDFDFLINRIN